MATAVLTLQDRLRDPFANRGGLLSTPPRTRIRSNPDPTTLISPAASKHGRGLVIRSKTSPVSPITPSAASSRTGAPPNGPSASRRPVETRCPDLRASVSGCEVIPEGGVETPRNPIPYPRALKIGIKAMFAPCLAKRTRYKEYAAGALLALCSESEIRQMLLVQSDCTCRAKRKARMLLKLLRDSVDTEKAGDNPDQSIPCTGEGE